MAVAGPPLTPPPASRRRLWLALAALAVAAVAIVGLLFAFPPSRAIHNVVSNQSLDRPLVNITVTVDGAVAVDQSFFVGDQHNYTQFDVRATRGDLVFEEHDTGAAGTATVTPFGDRWVTLVFWSGPEAPHITISDSAMAPAFA